jgi:hypothetical protein
MTWGLLEPAIMSSATVNELGSLEIRESRWQISCNFQGRLFCPSTFSVQQGAWLLGSDRQMFQIFWKPE